MKMMNSGNFLLILTVLLFGLVLVSFLGNSSKEGYTGATIADPNGAPIPVNYSDSNGNTALLSNNGYSYIMMITNSNSNPVAYTSTTNSYTSGAFGAGSQSIGFAGPTGLTGQLVVVAGTISFEVTLPVASSGGTPMVSIFIPSYSSPTTAPTSAPTPTPTTTSRPTPTPTSTSAPSSQGGFTGQNGSKATISDINNNPIIVVTYNNGKTTTYTLPNNNSKPINTIHDMVNIMFYGPNGGSARVFQDAKGNLAIEATQPNGNTNIFTADDTYSFIFEPFGMGTSSGTNTKTSYNSDSDSDSDSGNNGNRYKNKARRYRRKYGNQGQGYNKYYNNSLPAGIPWHMIPRGQQDLYILKSEVVPPVCPVCPSSSACPKKEKAPPCPPCARCPEPSFECKKVPNYNSNAFDSGYNSGSDDEFGSFSGNSNSNSILPEPVVSSFSTFGM